jgi:hypothetical protein
MSIAPAFGDAGPTPIEIDPRPCEFCGLTIDQHRMIDTGEGPEFYCIDVSPDEMTIDELNEAFEREIVLAAAEIVRRWELADPRDRWKHTGEPPPTERVRNSDIGARSAPASRPHRTPQATIDAFWYVVSLKDPDRLSAWLRDHPRDTARLLKLLEAQ